MRPVSAPGRKEARFVEALCRTRGSARAQRLDVMCENLKSCEPHRIRTGGDRPVGLAAQIAAPREAGHGRPIILKTEL
jgi:hypothetical protein